MTKDFWDNFYKDFEEKKPSSFAEFLTERMFNKKYNVKIMDIGCGNGRDTIYFKNLGCNVLGVDQSLPEKIKGLTIFQNKSIEELTKQSIFFSDFDIAYCRFLFHAIDEKLEDKLLDWIKNSFEYLCAEFRSDDGEIQKDDHYRRLINGERFLKKLIDKGFKIKYFNKGRFSKYNNEDPILIRVIAKVL